MGPTCNSVGPIWLGLGRRNLGETDYTNSMRPILVISKPESWSGKLDGTDSLISVRPKCYEREADSLHSNLGGTDRSSGGTKTLQRETERLQSHLGETEIPIGDTDFPRVCGSGYDI